MAAEPSVWNNTSQGWKINKILLGTNLIWPATPSEITEEFTLTKTSQSIYKSWYKIKQVVLEYTCSYNTSWRQDWGSFIADNYNWATSTGNAGCAVPWWPQRWYDYGNNGRRWRIYSDKISSWYWLVGFQQSSTTNSQCSVQMTWTRESLSYKVGKTYNNWLEQNTVSLNSTWKTNIANIFDSVNAWAYYWWRWQNSVTAKAIVTYESL